MQSRTKKHMAALWVLTSISLPYLAWSKSEGSWIANDVEHLGSQVRLDINSRKPGVQFSFKPKDKIAPRSIEVIFTNKQGKKFPLELKTMDPTQNVVMYHGDLSRASSFIGFEIRIPFKRMKPVVIDSNQMSPIVP